MRLENTIEITASPDVVWAITEDVERWPEWNPTVTSVVRVDSGPFQLGSRARIKQPLQPEAEWIVTEYEAGRRFSWETRRTGLHMVGTHDVSRQGGGARSVLSVDAAGFLSILLWPVLRLAMLRSLADENRGLRSRSEQIAAAGSDRTGGAGR